MVNELRRLKFVETEIRSALVDFCYRTHIEWPKANVERIAFNADPTRFLSIVFSQVSSTSPAFDRAPNIVLSRDQVFAALLLFCKKHTIHLKRESKKTISFDDGGNIILQIEGAWETA